MAQNKIPSKQFHGTDRNLKIREVGLGFYAYFDKPLTGMGLAMSQCLSTKRLLFLSHEACALHILKLIQALLSFLAAFLLEVRAIYMQARQDELHSILQTQAAR